MLRKMLILFFCLVCQGRELIFSAIPAGERAALIAFYNSTSGDTWSDNKGWKDEPLEADGFGPAGSEGTWNGIGVSADHVTEISMSCYTGLKGTLPPEIGYLVYLERLDLIGNPSFWPGHYGLGGKLPPEMGKLKNLRYLNLGYHGFDGSIRGTFGEISKLEELHLDFNFLSGSIPGELGKLENLRIFFLGHNQLNGPIPPELGDITNLEVLDLLFNHLTGTIPKELGKLKNLRELKLSMNLLSGSIPADLGNLVNLTHLNADFNRLTGGIPSELGKLAKLTFLNLRSNHLSGELPRQLGQLTQLEHLDLSGNRLVGKVPSTFIHLVKLATFEVDHNGLFTNDNTLRIFLLGIYNNWENLQTVAPKGVSAKGIDTSAIRVSWTPIRYVEEIGGYRVYYRTAPGKSWNYGGMTADKYTSSYAVSGLMPGTEYFFIIKTQTGLESVSFNNVTSVSSKEVSASTLDIRPAADRYPFGTMELPREDWEVKSGSMAVIGWALDDVEVAGVQIYCLIRDSKLFIGDAVFVEGARPDVEQAYPGYPFNRRAGWGYLLLTNVLPDGGYGIYALQAVAIDRQGNETILGTRTVFCDNFSTLEPFGALDTPAQGGLASGSAFINFGWALSSLYNLIPRDGSTIGVWVDGVFLGHPVYNQYREDIAALFPGYHNRSGAGGYFHLDTTPYENGLHTINWSVSDEAGHSAGIGSRYFSIQNPDSRQQASGNKQQAVGSRKVAPMDILQIPVDSSGSVGVIRGYRLDGEPQEIYPDEHHTMNIDIHPLERLEICLAEGGRVLTPLSGGRDLPGAQWMGFQVIGSRFGPLPTGSFLDTRQGIFYWQPGAAFMGNYRLVFIKTDQYGGMTKKNVSVTIGVVSTIQ